MDPNQFQQELKGVGSERKRISNQIRYVKNNTSFFDNSAAGDIMDLEKELAYLNLAADQSDIAAELLQMPLQEIYNILYGLDYDSMVSFCHLNNAVVRGICAKDNDYFWRNKLMKSFPDYQEMPPGGEAKRTYMTLSYIKAGKPSGFEWIAGKILARDGPSAW